MDFVLKRTLPVTGRLAPDRTSMPVCVGEWAGWLSCHLTLVGVKPSASLRGITSGSGLNVELPGVIFVRFSGSADLSL